MYFFLSTHLYIIQLRYLNIFRIDKFNFALTIRCNIFLDYFYLFGLSVFCTKSFRCFQRFPPIIGFVCKLKAKQLMIRKTIKLHKVLLHDFRDRPRSRQSVIGRPSIFPPIILRKQWQVLSLISLCIYMFSVSLYFRFSYTKFPLNSKIKTKLDNCVLQLSYLLYF